MQLTERLKQELWQRFGTQGHPAEWDGLVYGGGKLSQRYWEYFQSIELLALTEDSVILDIGGGSPVTGMGFFSSLLATVAKRVIVMDPNIRPDATPPPNVTFVREPADEDRLGRLLDAHPELTHISCVSVFEHIEPSVREGIIRAVDGHFGGQAFIATLEYHAKRTYFEHALTAATLSDLFSPFTRFYPDQFCASPVWCQDAFDTRVLFRPFRRKKREHPVDIPRWYPIAFRFVPVA